MNIQVYCDEQNSLLLLLERYKEQIICIYLIFFTMALIQQLKSHDLLSHFVYSIKLFLFLALIFIKISNRYGIDFQADSKQILARTLSQYMGFPGESLQHIFQCWLHFTKCSQPAIDQGWFFENDIDRAQSSLIQFLFITKNYFLI